MVTQSGESVSQNMIIKNSYKELPSERFYDWLDRDLTSTTQYYSDCNTLDAPYKNNQEIRSLCAKVVKYIKTKPSILNGNHLKDHQCNLFNYWLYEKLIRYYGDSSSVPFHVFGDFLRVLSGFTYYPKDVTCKLDNSIPMIPDRQDRKKLYDYCVDYKTILEMSKLSKDKCYKYYAHVQEKIGLYKKFQALCSPRDESKCPDFFYKICDKRDPSVLLAQLKCDDIGVRDKSSQEDASGTTSNTSPSIESVSNLGNAFLGVVVTSMTSGLLYKVNTNLIKINK
ncbi:hypothetical protein PVNG_06007 [Plasmodium vivax North Korean]|uniref:Uncharacterized protein n=1 Tax=Plasmodium vivax North Korean TaxID=1035514 RepID=A0A0J9U380_PLAVI|nr:hypothetical protein PVNG_06007 [Plasmodium vivax North Korean]